MVRIGLRLPIAGLRAARRCQEEEDPVKMPGVKTYLGLTGLLALLLAAFPAYATDFCIVQKSADGFVALRAAPMANGELLRRAKAGEAVVIQKDESGNQIVNGRWLRVMHFPDEVVPQKGDPAYKKGKAGWMHQRYIDECG